MYDAIWSRVHLHRGIKAYEVCLSWVAHGSTDAPLHYLRADVGALLIEGHAGTSSPSCHGKAGVQVGVVHSGRASSLAA